MFLLGKNIEKGTIPLWSYIVWFPFYIPNFLYTFLHTKYGSFVVRDALTGKYRKERVPVASEVLPGMKFVLLQHFYASMLSCYTKIIHVFCPSILLLSQVGGSVADILIY